MLNCTRYKGRDAVIHNLFSSACALVDGRKIKFSIPASVFYHLEDSSTSINIQPEVICLENSYFALLIKIQAKRTI